MVVCAGMPTDERGPQKALEALLGWAKGRKKAVLLFGVELADLPWLSRWTIRELGRQPIFVAGDHHKPCLNGAEQPQKGREMRRQARRATSKGVRWSESSAAKVWEHHAAGALTPLLAARWRRQPLAEFSFLVGLHLASGQAVRRYFLLTAEPTACGKAEKAIAATADELLGLAIIVRSQRGWLLEHHIIGSQAPNGSGELLIAQLLSEKLAPGELLSLGITPLYRALVCDLPHQEIPAILSFMPRAMRTTLLSAWEPMYGFRRLERFRTKLEPDRWEPVYWAQRGVNSARSLWAVLQVFAGGSFLQFGWATLGKLFAKVSLGLGREGLWRVNSFFLLSLCVWIPILWQLDGERLFGTPVATKMWAIYDLVLVLGFIFHGYLLGKPQHRFRKFSGVMFGLVAADACLCSIWGVLLYREDTQSLFLTLFVLLLAAAPLAASALFALCLAYPTDFLRHGGSRNELENL